MKKRITSIILALCMILTMLPLMVLAMPGAEYEVTVNAGAGGKVSTDGVNWQDSVTATVYEGETLGEGIKYLADEHYELGNVTGEIVGSSSHRAA